MQKKTTSLFFLIFCFSFYAKPQQSITDSIHYVKEFVITARPYQEIIPSQKLQGADLHRLNSHNVADALRYFSGIQLKDYGGMGGLKTVNIRNMGSQHVGVFYDGVQLGNVQNGTVDLGRYSIDDIEELSLYNGQKSEIFQSAKDYASASSIYIRSKRPRFKEGEKTKLTTRYKFGTIHLVNPSFRLEQKFSPRWSMSLSNEYIKSGGEYKFRYKKKLLDGSIAYDTTAYRKNSDIEAYRLEAGLYGSLKDGYLETKIYYYQSQRGLPGAIVNNVFQRGERMHDKNFFMQSSYTKDITRKYKLKLQGKFAFDYTKYLPSGLKYYQQEYYFSLINMYKMQTWWDISLSLDYQHNSLNASMVREGIQFAYPDRNSIYMALANSFTFEKLKAQASLLGNIVLDNVKYGEDPSNKNKFSPALFLGYTPFDKINLNIRAFYKQIFRMPSFNELYYGADVLPKLKPEMTHQYNLGLSYNLDLKSNCLKEINFQIDAYYIDIKDKIMLEPTSPSRWSVRNIGKVRSKGIDTQLGALGKVEGIDINAKLSYSYQRAQDLSNSKSTIYKHQIPYAPWHSATVTLGAAYKSWDLNYSYIYLGKRYHSNNIQANEMKPWHTHDISLNKEVAMKNFIVKGSIEVNNAFNQYHDVVINYPMPGREFKFTINIKL